MFIKLEIGIIHKIPILIFNLIYLIFDILLLYPAYKRTVNSLVSNFCFIHQNIWYLNFFFFHVARYTLEYTVFRFLFFSCIKYARYNTGIYCTYISFPSKKVSSKAEKLFWEKKTCLDSPIVLNL